MDDSKTEIAVLHEKILSAERAMTLQAKEYERRLSGLNDEAGRLKRMQETYLPREVYDKAHEIINVKIGALEKFVYIGLGSLAAVEFFLRYFK